MSKKYVLFYFVLAIHIGIDSCIANFRAMGLYL